MGTSLSAGSGIIGKLLLTTQSTILDLRNLVTFARLYHSIKHDPATKRGILRLAQRCRASEPCDEHPSEAARSQLDLRLRYLTRAAAIHAVEVTQTKPPPKGPCVTSRMDLSGAPSAADHNN